MLKRCLGVVTAWLMVFATLWAAPAWSAPTARAPAASASAASAAGSAAVAPAAGAVKGAAAAGSLAVAFDTLEKRSTETSTAIRYVIVLTVAALIPSLLICMTAFLRIAIVLSMLRHAIGMPETPPNAVLIGLALFLTLFTMAPVLQTVNTQALQPFMNGTIGIGQGLEQAGAPLREFMIRQTREADLALMVELSKAPAPQSMADIGNLQLIPAFMLSELRAAFQIGFVVFLPFLLIDLIVSSILMSLGMMMMPPITIALPIKILMFVLVDGWSVIVKALVGSFH
jgi:flagellar biosynthesis protein FliP